MIAFALIVVGALAQETGETAAPPPPTEQAERTSTPAPTTDDGTAPAKSDPEEPPIDDGGAGDTATPPPADDAAAAPTEPETAASAVELHAAVRIEHALTLVEIDALLDDVAARAGAFGALETLGSSRHGHAIRMLTLTAPGSSSAEKPALLAVGYGRVGEDFGAEAALAFADLLVRNAAVEPYASLLADHVVFVAPALDPDVRAADAEATDETRFDLNFPLGWRPDSLRPGSGDFPLSEVESLAAARFLGRTPNLVLIVGVGGDVGRGAHLATAPWPGAVLPASDALVFETLAGAEARGVALHPWGRLGSSGGSFFDYAFQAFGIYPVAWGRPSEVTSLGAWSDEVARRTAELLFSLPRVRIESDELTELAPGLWQLDVAVRNAGSIPTLSALGDQRQVPGELMLRLDGAKLVATARRSDADEAYQLARLHGADDGVSLGGPWLGGGETRWLRLIVEGDPGTRLGLSAASARAGSSRLERVLE